MPEIIQHFENDPRELLRRLRRILNKSPDLKARFLKTKEIIRIFRRPAFYEISQRCNLLCEGCYYFEDKHRQNTDSEMIPEQWERFFEEENRRGVSMAYLVGAEPALYTDRLLAASRNIHFGKIGTNGTIRIDSEVEFRIGVSIWGDDDHDAKLRGGSVLRKAFSNYEGDPRAIMLFTLSPWNLHTVKDVVRMTADHGLQITFSMFSPTTTYLNKLANSAPIDNQFFRLAHTLKSPVFSDDDLRRASDASAEVMDTHPDTVLFTHGYNKRITRPGSLYMIDKDSGMAEDCASRIHAPLRYYRADGSSQSIKCCTPGVECEYCRLYSGGWSSLFRPEAEYLIDESSFTEWLEMIEMVGRIFLYPYPFNEGT